jgi:hypothetical protein
VQVDAVLHRDAQLLERPGQIVLPGLGADDHDHLGVGAGTERGERRREIFVGRQGLRRSGAFLTSEGHELPAEDDDARSLPLGQLLGDVAAGGQRAGRGGGGKEEIAQHHDPAPEGDLHVAHRVRSDGEAVVERLIEVGTHAASMVSPKAALGPPSWVGSGFERGADPAR